MRLIAFILSLFLFANVTSAFSTEYTLRTDTVKRTVIKQKHNRVVHNWPKPKSMLPPDKLYYNDCVFIHKYTIAQRLKKYPFSKAAKILAVSYDSSMPNAPIITDTDTIKHLVSKKHHGLFINNGRLDYSSLFEVKQLTSSQINRLTNMMFNTDVKVHNNYATASRACFDPRNAFIFFDKDGKVFDYIEICFECERTESKSGKLYLGSGCNQELDMTKKFLIGLGIKFGTTTTDDTGFN